MRRETVIRRKKPSVKQPEKDTTRTMIDQSKEILKHPVVKGVAIVAALYGVLFISKYIIKEYAEVVIATKKLRDAHRL
jgi:ribulose 1,5-bisphosphate synthetase/thiazole synthase